jgi:ATP-dependent RNA/DNA helicase IGHMBP2
MSTGHTFQQPLFQRLAALMAIEARAEQEKLQQQIQQMTPTAAEQTGNSLIQLTIREEVAGLGGRVLVTLGKRNQQLDLALDTAARRVTSAAERRAGARQPQALARGCQPSAPGEHPGGVADSGRNRSATGPPFASIWPGDEIALQRELAALRSADQAKGDRLAALRAVLLGEVAPRFQPSDVLPPIATWGSTRSSSRRWPMRWRRKMWRLFMARPARARLPPWLQLIQQAVQRGEKVLACAPSNLAVDNIFERLLAIPGLGSGANVVRIGHPGPRAAGSA